MFRFSKLAIIEAQSKTRQKCMYTHTTTLILRTCMHTYVYVSLCAVFLLFSDAQAGGTRVPSRERQTTERERERESGNGEKPITNILRSRSHNTKTRVLTKNRLQANPIKWLNNESTNHPPQHSKLERRLSKLKKKTLLF